MKRRALVDVVFCIRSCSCFGSSLPFPAPVLPGPSHLIHGDITGPCDGSEQMLAISQTLGMHQVVVHMASCQSSLSGREQTFCTFRPSHPGFRFPLCIPPQGADPEKAAAQALSSCLHFICPSTSHALFYTRARGTSAVQCLIPRWLFSHAHRYAYTQHPEIIQPWCTDYLYTCTAS